MIPTPHRNTLKLFGMGLKTDYLLCHFYKGTFIALDKESIMSVWSTATGKILCSKSNKINDNGNESPLFNFEIY